jgi:hypothetical protein
VIDEKSAADMAREVARTEGWPFAEPIECVLRRDWCGRPACWEIRTAAGRFGTIACFCGQCR